MSTFTTAGLGVIPGTGGDVDDVVRSLAWKKAHPAATIGTGEPGQFRYTAKWAGCEVEAHPLRPGVVVARQPAPGLWLLEGSPGEVRAEVRAAVKRAEVRASSMREFLSCLGTLGRAG